jgi:hypothetical protein
LHRKEIVTTKWKVIAAFGVLTAVFLAGFVPQFLEKRRVTAELQDVRTRLSTAQKQMAIDEVRNLAGLILLHASHQNYGTAREYSTQYFNKLRELADQSESATLKSSASELLQSRDSITSGLAQGTSSVVSELQVLLAATYSLPDAEGNLH